MAKAQKPISVLVASRYRMVVQELEGLLRSTSDLEIVGGAVGLDEAVRKYRQLRPDVLIADVAQQPEDLADSASFRAQFPKVQTGPDKNIACSGRGPPQ